MFAPIIASFLLVFDTIVGLYIFVVIAAVIVGWLIAFGVLNTRNNDLARQLVNILDALTDPVFRRVRRVIPPLAGIDFSPFIVILALRVLQILVDNYIWMLAR